LDEDDEAEDMEVEKEEKEKEKEKDGKKKNPGKRKGGSDKYDHNVGLQKIIIKRKRFVVLICIVQAVRRK